MPGPAEDPLPDPRLASPPPSASVTVNNTDLVQRCVKILEKVHTTLHELMGTVDKSLALFTQQDRIRFFHMVTMRHLRFTASSFKVSLEEEQQPP